MVKAERILNSFPGYYQATDPYKLLRQVVERLAEPLEEADTLLFRIQRAHRIKVAEDVEDIIRLAAVLGLTAFHFEDIVTNGDVSNQSFQEAAVRLAIQGVQERTVLPSVFCPATEEGIVFHGVVPDGQTLIVDDAGGATLDGHRVDDWIGYFRGALADFTVWRAARVAQEQPARKDPLDRRLGEPAFAPFPQKKPVPKAPMAKSSWHFKVAEGLYDGSAFDFAVYATAHEPIGEYDSESEYGRCVFDYPASGVVGMTWGERILGQSVIRNADADHGAGVDYHATRVRDANADIFLPFDESGGA